MTNISKFFCHRMPERTFKIRNTYFPVCSRCTGIYIGAFSYLVAVYFIAVQYSTFTSILAILLIIPTFLDGITQFLRYRESNNTLRFSTGLLAGIGLSIMAKTIKFAMIN